MMAEETREPNPALDKLDDVEWRLSAACSVIAEQVRTRELQKGQRLVFVMLIDEKQWQMLSVDASRAKSFVIEYPEDGAGIAPACTFCGARATCVSRKSGACCCDECAGSDSLQYERI